MAYLDLYKATLEDGAEKIRTEFGETFDLSGVLREFDKVAGNGFSVESMQPVCSDVDEAIDGIRTRLATEEADPVLEKEFRMLRGHIKQIRDKAGLILTARQFLEEQSGNGNHPLTRKDLSERINLAGSWISGMVRQILESAGEDVDPKKSFNKFKEIIGEGIWEVEEEQQDMSSFLGEVNLGGETEKSLNSPLSVFFRNVKRYEVLSSSEQLELVMKAKIPQSEKSEFDTPELKPETIAARKKLLNHNLRLVIRIVNRFAKSYGIWQTDCYYMDLINCACEGYLSAIDKFDPAKGIKVNSFAVSYMNGFLLRAVYDILYRQNRQVQLTETGIHYMQILKKAREALAAESGERETTNNRVIFSDIVNMKQPLITMEELKKMDRAHNDKNLRGIPVLKVRYIRMYREAKKILRERGEKVTDEAIIQQMDIFFDFIQDVETRREISLNEPCFDCEGEDATRENVIGQNDDSFDKLETHDLLFSIWKTFFKVLSKKTGTKKEKNKTDKTLRENLEMLFVYILGKEDEIDKLIEAIRESGGRENKITAERMNNCVQMMRKKCEEIRGNPKKMGRMKKDVSYELIGSLYPKNGKPITKERVRQRLNIIMEQIMKNPDLRDLKSALLGE